MKNPNTWKPKKLGDFIGTAGTWARMLEEVVKQAKKSKDQSLKYLLHGPAGVGKSEVAKMVAYSLAAKDFDVQVVAGRNLRADDVQKLRNQMGTGSLYGEWVVLIIEEADTCPRDGQDALLTFLDELPKCRAVLATSNKELGDLTDRFQTRFQHLQFKEPSTADIAKLLARFDGMSPECACEIAEGADGNVRAALLDAQTHLDYQRFMPLATASEDDYGQVSILETIQ